MSFGSTTPEAKAELNAKFDKRAQNEDLTANEIEALGVSRRTQNMVGLSIELQKQSQRIRQLFEQQRALINLVQTLQNQFTQFEAQRATELKARLGGGPTAVPQPPE
jgi:hypothetical protein